MGLCYSSTSKTIIFIFLCHPRNIYKGSRASGTVLCVETSMMRKTELIPALVKLTWDR